MTERSGVITNSGVPETRSIGEIAQDILRDFQQVVRGEIRLARTEVSENWNRAKSAGTIFGAAAVCGLVAAGALAAAGIAALAMAMPVWTAALIVSFVFACFAGVGLAMVRGRLQSLDAIPRQTTDSLKDDVEWARHQMK
jgi:hypothetical protein